MAKKRKGIGANCTVLLKFLHSKKDINEKFPNRTAQDRLENCIIIGLGEKSIRNAETQVMLFRHDEFPDKQLYCVPRYAKVIEEGPAEHLFEGHDRTEDTDGEILVTVAEEDWRREIPIEVQQARNVQEDIALV